MFTILLSPGAHCTPMPVSGKSELGWFSPPSDAASIFGDFNTDNGCGDLIFSSHMMIGLVCALAISAYSGNAAFKALLWLLCTALAFLIVMQHSHYTVDVIIAWYVTPMVWVSFRHFFPWDIENHVFFWKDQPLLVYRGLKQTPVDDPIASSF